MRQSILNGIKSLVFVLSISCLSAGFIDAYASHPGKNKRSRYVPNVVSIIQDHDYIRTHAAPVYWEISPFYLSQLTNASCSLTSATMVINALRIHHMQFANQTLATTNSVVHRVNNAWENDVKQGGHGVTLDQFGLFLEQAIKAYHNRPVKLDVIHVTKSNDSTTKFHKALLDGEKTGRTFIIVNFDQKFISGDAETAGHFAPVGAYDVNTKRVLIMDPDRESFEPYWVPENRLIDSMDTEDSDLHQHRGFVVVKSP